MTEELRAGKAVVFSHDLTIQQSAEPAVVISKRQYSRLVERLEGCRPRGWADLWLAGVGAGAALAIAAVVGIKTLPQSPEACARNVLWVLAALGIVAAGLCVLAYLGERRDHAKEIDEVRRDLEILGGD